VLDRYAVLINQAFDVIDETAASVSVEVPADTLLNFMVNLQGETKALVSVLEASTEWTRRLKFPELFHKRLVKTLLLCVPRHVDTGRAKRCRRSDAQLEDDEGLYSIKALPRDPKLQLNSV